MKQAFRQAVAGHPWRNVHQSRQAQPGLYDEMRQSARSCRSI